MLDGTLIDKCNVDVKFDLDPEVKVKSVRLIGPVVQSHLDKISTCIPITLNQHRLGIQR